MIFPIITIIALAGVFIILVRRFPATKNGGLVRPTAISFRMPKIAWRLPNLSGLKLPKIKLPSLPTFGGGVRIDQSPIFHDDDILAQADDAFGQKDFVNAEQLYLQSATKYPKQARIYARLGVIYLQEKNYKDARDALLSSLKFESDNASRHYNLSLAYQGMDLPKKALAEVKRAVELDGANPKYDALKQKLES